MVVRRAMLAASQIGAFRTVATATPVVRGLMDRYVAGPEAGDAVRVGGDLAAVGLHCTIDYLGEPAIDEATADATVRAYQRLLGALDQADLGDRTELSLKLSAVGQGIGDHGEEIALANTHQICDSAAKFGIGVTLNMEEHTAVAPSLQTLRELRKDFPNTGVVLQAYLRRTEQDCVELAQEGSRVGLCKGAYVAPREVAFVTSQDIDLSYVRCLKELLAGAGTPLIATHDKRLIEIAEAIAVRTRRERGSYEVQMLYGVHSEEQKRLAAMGERVRVYVPYGPQWYPYVVRRMAENPGSLIPLSSSITSRL